MKENEALSRAICIAATEFDGIMDKGGAPYILHCLAVMEGVRQLGFPAMTAAVLHDLLEDRPAWSAERLREEGFAESIITAITLLTRQDGENYMEYVARLAGYPMARAIKLADLTHNMNPARLSDLSERSMARMRKYHAAYQFLQRY